MESAALCCPHSKFTALICCSGHSVWKRSGIPVQGVDLVCSVFFPFFVDQIQADIDRNYQNLFHFFIDTKLGSFFPDSCRVNLPIGAMPVTPRWVCCSPGSRAGVRTRSRSCASAACWWCQCMSSCTGVGGGSTQMGRKLPCCKLSTWRQFPSEGW